MARGEKKLSAAIVEKRKEPGRLGDGNGLWLVIKKSGSRSWVFRYSRPAGGVTEIGLGGYPAISLSEARGLTAEYRELLARGTDPKSHVDNEKATVQPKTFGEVAERYIEAMKPKWSNPKSEHQWRKSLLETCAKICSKPAADINTDDILKVLSPIWVKTPETAMRTRGRIEAVLDFAVVEDERSEELRNPARWRGHLDKRLVSRKKHEIRHHPAMDYKDVPDFVAQLQERDAPAARALELTILTAARSGEILNAVWSEFRLDDRLWTIPAGRMKAREEHVVPLSPRAIEILRTQLSKQKSDYVFAGSKRGRPLSNMSMQMLMRRMKIENAAPHGFRSSFRDWAGNETEFAREIAEACLAHIVGSRVERAYRRSRAIEKQRALLTAWADYCSGVKAAGNVVQLKVG